MSLAVDVVKHGGHRPTESFDKNKLHASILAACLSVRTPEGTAHDTATRVCDALAIWCSDKPEVTSADIRRQASQALSNHHSEAAYFYNHHRVIM